MNRSFSLSLFSQTGRSVRTRDMVEGCRLTIGYQAKTQGRKQLQHRDLGCSGSRGLELATHDDSKPRPGRTWTPGWKELTDSSRRTEKQPWREPTAWPAWTSGWHDNHQIMLARLDFDDGTQSGSLLGWRAARPSPHDYSRKQALRHTARPHQQRGARGTRHQCLRVRRAQACDHRVTKRPREFH